MYKRQAKYSDSVWLNKANDTIQQEVNEEVNKFFSDFTMIEEELYVLFQHITYYFPEIATPRIVTITNDVDYRNKVVIGKGLLIIALDTYLGEDHHFYAGIQKYLRQNFKKDQIVPDIAAVYAKNKVGPVRDRTFLGNMIAVGKELYVKNLLLPKMDEARKLGYTKAQYDWIVANEEEIWKFFIEKNLLYSTEKELLPRFLYPAPFSKFYLEEIDKEAPDRVAQCIGLWIVDAYMKNNNVSLQQLLITDPETIFNRSKYKPRK